MYTDKDLTIRPVIEEDLQALWTIISKIRKSELNKMTFGSLKWKVRSLDRLATIGSINPPNGLRWELVFMIRSIGAVGLVPEHCDCGSRIYLIHYL